MDFPSYNCTWMARVSDHTCKVSSLKEVCSLSHAPLLSNKALGGGSQDDLLQYGMLTSSSLNTAHTDTCFLLLVLF